MLANSILNFGIKIFIINKQNKMGRVVHPLQETVAAIINTVKHMRKIIFESIGIEDQKSIKKSSFTKILDSFLDIIENLKVTDGSNKDFYDKLYNPSLEVVKQSIDK